MSTTWINRGHLYAPHVMPVLADLTFTVDPTNANGLGVSSVKGQAVQNVFMHTSQTPGKGPNGKLNPNPAVGYILIQLADNYTRLYSAQTTVRSPVTGSALAVNATALTAGVAYQIVTVGTSTAADWLALGVPSGVTPAAGVSFICLVTGTGAGNGTVKAVTASTIDAVEMIGDPNLSIGPVPVGGSPNVGGWVLLQCLSSTATANTALIPTAPVALSQIAVCLYMNQSSVMVAGE